MANQSIKVATWNVRGLNNFAKARRVLSMLHNTGVSVVFLQETHLLREDGEKFARRWGAHRYFASHTRGFRGVAIMIHKSLQFKLETKVEDVEGRFLYVTGTLQGKHVQMLNMYGPNVDTVEFYEKTLRLLRPGVHTEWLVAGDLNMTMHRTLDRSQDRSGRIAKAAQYVIDWAETYGMVDVWRALHPDEKKFTFYSSPHDVYSRIDYLYCSRGCMVDVDECVIEARSLSDHSMVWMGLLWTRADRERHWSFKTEALRDLVFSTGLTEALDTFLQANDPRDTNYATTWAAMKVYVRGICMSLEGSLLRNLRADITKLRVELNGLEGIPLEGRRPGHTGEVRAKVVALEGALDRENLFLVWPHRVKSYMQGERPGKVLASIVRGDRSRNAITGLRDAQGSLCTDTGGILAILQEYFVRLYSERGGADLDTIRRYVASLQLPQLTSEERRGLDDPLTEGELKAALKDLASGKVPGPDGLTIAFYKKYALKLLPLLAKVWAEACNNGTLAADLAEATIVLLLKPNKQGEECGDYRPLSLINNDVKILAKALALRLTPLMGRLVHPDQAGFIPGRSTICNLRRLTTVMALVDADSDASVVSLDAAKAFDSVDWSYMFEVMGAFNVGPGFVKMLRVLYSNASAKICVNGRNSASLRAERGTRQGCPLSPLLFALILEPLAATLRKGLEGKGIMAGGLENVISLYADDMLIYLGNPRRDLGTVIAEYERFGGMSGVHINWDKSALLPLARMSPQLVEGTALRYEAAGIKYLGLYVTRDIHLAFHKNLGALLQYFEPRVRLWLKLPLTTAGRIAILKMLIMPRFLYIFAHYPYPIPKSFFSACKRLAVQLLWGSGARRIAYDTLTRSIERGGLAAPCLYTYYRAAQLQYIVELMGDGDRMGHVQMQRYQCRPLGVGVYINAPETYRGLTPSPLKTSLKVWESVLMKEGQGSPFHGSMPLLSSPLALKASLRAGMEHWHEKGYVCLGDLYEDGILKAKRTLLGDLGGTAAVALVILQVMAFIRHRWGLGQLAPEESQLLKEVMTLSEGGKPVSQVYKLLQGVEHAHPLRIKAIWERDLGKELTDSQWKMACEHTKTVSSAMRFRLIQYKYLTQWYLTPLRLVKFVLGTDTRCCKCQGGPATFYHMVWECPVVQSFWSDVCNELSKMVGRVVDKVPEVILLGCMKKMDPLLRKFLGLALLLAKRMIAMVWMRKEAPRLDTWMRAMAHCQAIESRIPEVLGTCSMPRYCWEWFDAHVSNLEDEAADD